MAVLLKNEDPEERRRRIIDEALEHRRRHPLPPVEEVLAEARRLRESIPRGPEFPDSTVLLREDRER
jgi:hypothetical protein